MTAEAQTIENTREKDETLVETGDAVLEADEANDEFAGMPASLLCWSSCSSEL